ncbi:MAG: hypothetical protein AB7O96_13765 [Pseudobdellovibrionaceae bacterium]
MTLISLLITALSAFADHRPPPIEYTCFAPANPTRGFLSDFYISVTRLDLGGKIFLTSDGMTQQLGAIHQTNTFTRDDDATGSSFSQTLALLDAEDMTGIPSTSEVDSIERYASNQAQHQLIVYKFFQGTEMKGGAFAVNSRATKCLPQ